MNDVNALFERIQTINAKDPADLESNDIDALVTYYRYRRTHKSEVKRGELSLDSLIPATAPKLAPGFDRRGL